MTDYYADTVGNIAVTGHLVRIDFLSQASPAPHQPPLQQGAQIQVVTALSCRLMASCVHFVLQQIRAKLIAVGVVNGGKRIGCPSRN